MNGYLLDTSLFVVQLRRGGDYLPRLIADLRLDRCYICPVVVTELHFGVLRSQQPASQLQRLNVVLNAFRSLAITDKTAVIAAQINASLTVLNQRIGINDTWIAAIAKQHGLAVVTTNVQHFQRVPELQVITAT
jgi:tRNA(fMet)-specific endonuclease VapC